MQRPLAAVLLFFCAVPTLAQQVDPRSFQTANGLLSRGMNELAVEEYRKFLADHEDHAKVPVARYGLAVALFRLNDAAGAAAELDQVMEVEGFEFAPESRVLLGQCRLALGRNGEAASSFGEVVRDYGDHELADDAAGLLVEALYRDGQYEQAEEAGADLEGSWAQSPARDRAELFRGMAQMAQGEFNPAAERFEVLIRKTEDDDLRDRSALLLAQCRHRAGQGDAAAEQYQAVVESNSAFVPDALLGLAALRHEQGKPKEAAPLLDRLLTQHAQSPIERDALLRRGRVRIDLGAYDQAMQDLQAVQKGAEGSSDEAAYWIAKCHLRAGRADEAGAALVTAIEKFPESRLAGEMRYDLAVAQTRAGDDEGARETLAEFQRRFEEHVLAPEATHLSAVVAHQLKDYEASLAVCRRFERQFADHPLTPAVEFLAAENLLLSGHDAEAAGAYAAFLENRPGDERADMASFRLGATLHRLGNPADARPFLEQVAKGGQTPEEFRTALLLLGDVAFGEGDWATARERLSEYIALGTNQPSADDALLKLGLAASREGDHGAAITSFDRLLEEMPQSEQALQAHFERGQALVAMNRGDEAASEFEQVLATDPESRFAPYAHNHLGALASAKGDQDAAVKHFQAAGSGGEEVQADALFREALAHAAAGRHREAFDAFSRLTEAFPSHPRSGEAAARRAIELSRLGEHAAALEAIDAAPRDGLDAKLLDALDYERAWDLRQTGQADESVKAYKALLTNGKDPALRPYAMTDLAELEAEAGRHGDAATLLTGVRAAKDVPPDLRARATYLLGVSEFRLDHFDKAAPLMEEFLGGTPGALAASASLVAGESLFRLNRHEKAADHLRRVVEKHAADPAAATAMLRLGESLAALQKWADSERVFESYLSKYPESELWFQARFGLGWARENQSRQTEAIEAYREVAEKHQGPTAARAQFQIGECLFALSRHDEAAKELLKVDILYAYPEWSAAALYEAGRCFEAMNDPDQARAQYQSVVERFKESKWAALATQRLAAVKQQELPGRGRQGGRG